MLGPLRHFRLLIVRLSLIATGIFALALYFWVDSPSARGMLMGGIGSTVTFWIMARQVEKLASIPPERLQLATYRWTFIRLFVYAFVLYGAYRLDTETYHGLMGALGGLLLHRAIIIFVAATGLDLKQEE